MAKSAFLYVRFSTEEQKKGDSLRRQEDLAGAYATAHGLEIVTRYEDLGVSAYKGRNLFEGDLGRFLSDVRAGKIPAGSILLVEAFDRLSRQKPLDALAPVMEIMKNGITIVTTQDGRRYGSDADMPDIVFAIMKMGTGHHESRSKDQRLREVWAAKRAEAAKPNGRKLTAMVPAWLTLDKTKHEFVINQEVAEIVRRIFRESAAGVGSRSIARRLNADGIPSLSAQRGRKNASSSWGHRSVKHVLASHSVVGRHWPQSGELIENYYPPIVTLSEFYGSQSALATRRVGGGGRKGASMSNLFGKVAICAACGRPMNQYNTGNRGGRYLACSAAKRGLCEMSRGWRYGDFECSFLTFMRDLDPVEIFGDDEASQHLSRMKGRLADIDGEILALRERAERLVIALEAGASPMLANRVHVLEAELVKAQAGRAQVSFNLEAEHARLRQTAPSRSLATRLLDGSLPPNDLFLARVKTATAIKAMIEKIYVTTIGDEEEPEQQSMIVITRDRGAVIIMPDPTDPLKLTNLHDLPEKGAIRNWPVTIQQERDGHRQ